MTTTIESRTIRVLRRLRTNTLLLRHEGFAGIGETIPMRTWVSPSLSLEISTVNSAGIRD